MTPYEAAKRINAILKANGLKEIPTQMMYNYTTARVNSGKAPLIPSIVENGVFVKIDETQFDAWLSKYLSKKGIGVKA